MKAVVYRMRVPFYDVDSMRVVYHGNYAKYFEEARCAYFEACGLSYGDMEEVGFLLPVVSLEIRYVRPCVFGQELEITVRREENDNLLVLRYDIRDAKTGERCCRGITRHAAVDAERRELLFELPPPFLARLKEAEKA